MASANNEEFKNDVEQPNYQPGDEPKREEPIRVLQRQHSNIFDTRGAVIQELAFLGLSYEVESIKPGQPAEQLKVLNGVSGQAKAGEMLALMGPSGSGKTSLLNVLAQRIPPKSITGSVSIDGQPFSKSFKRKMGFVFQDDICMWNLTVRETITFAGKLRLPQSLPEYEKEDRVTELLSMLGISHVANNMIGKEGRRGISGGERKRVSIGVELITSPHVLFLDEPTSGLDSSTALSIITLLRTLGQRNMIVISSIHQPRSNIFAIFDKVLLLNKGRTVYYGPRASVVRYFSSIGLELPPETNPADWILDMTLQRPNLPDGRSLADAYEQQTSAAMKGDSSIAIDLPTEATISFAKNRSQDNGGGSDKATWVTSFWYQLRILLQRQSKQSRGEVFNAVNLGQIFIVAVVASAIWWQSENVSDLAGAMFFVSIQQSFNGLSTSMRIFPPERGLMVRERSTGSYRVAPYFLAKSMSDIGMYTAGPIGFALVVYWCVGLRPDFVHFLIFLILFMSQVIMGQSLGLFISTAVPDVFTAQSISFVLILVLILFGGFYVNSENIPEGLRWLQYLSFLFYGFGAMLTNEFEGRIYSCEDAGGRGLIGLPSCAGEDGDGTVGGEEILDMLGFSDVDIWFNVLVLAIYIVGLRFVTYLWMRKYAKGRV